VRRYMHGAGMPPDQCGAWPDKLAPYNPTSCKLRKPTRPIGFLRQCCCVVRSPVGGGISIFIDRLGSGGYGHGDSLMRLEADPPAVSKSLTSTTHVARFHPCVGMNNDNRSRPHRMVVKFAYIWCVVPVQLRSKGRRD
jgi:hypothetical protein